MAKKTTTKKPAPTSKPTVPPKSELVKAECANCHGYRNHRVLHTETVPYPEEIGWGYVRFEIVECVGCDAVRFRREQFDEDDHYSGAGPSVSTYPNEVITRGSYNREIAALSTVGSIYVETHRALEGFQPMLAAAGLRACVEAVCKHEKVKGRNLVEKINELESKGLLTTGQAQLLHSARYLGNSSLHEIEEPDESDLQYAMKIVESLIETTYIFPAKAQQISKKYQTKKK